MTLGPWRRYVSKTGSNLYFKKEGYPIYVLTLKRLNGQVFVELSSPSKKTLGTKWETKFQESSSFSSFRTFYEEAAKEWAEDLIFSPMQRLREGLVSFVAA